MSNIHNSNIHNIEFQVVSKNFRTNINNVKLPQRATKHSMAYDFYSPVYTTIAPKKSVMIWTDVKAKFDNDIGLIINVRSSMGKYQIMLANTQGWIDSDYYGNESNDGNIGIRLYNLSDTPYVIEQGDKIAQGMFMEFFTTNNDDDNIKNERSMIYILNLD